MAEQVTPPAVEGTSPQPAPEGRGKFVIPIIGIGVGAFVAWVAILALLALVAVILVKRQEGPVSEGKRAPQFSLTTFDNQQITPEDMRGKVVVVNFWASWCKPCEQEAADLEAAWQYYKPRGDVLFLGIDYVDTEPEARGYLKKFSITYPNGPDLRTSISQAFRIIGVPETYVIDQEGYIVHTQIGVFNSVDEIRSVVDPLLPDEPAP